MAILSLRVLMQISSLAALQGYSQFLSPRSRKQVAYKQQLETIKRLVHLCFIRVADSHVLQTHRHISKKVPNLHMCTSSVEPTIFYVQSYLAANNLPTM
jgi:hypothetical protein